MIEIYAEDNFTAIKPLDSGSLDDTVRLYNSGSDTRYATGLEGDFSIWELSSLLERIKASDNEFIAGIYIKTQGKGAETVLRFTGLCSGILHESTLWIKQLSLLPEYRRRGIGTRTVYILLKYTMRSHSVQEAYLSVAEKNAAGLCFWRKLGFCEAYRIEKVLFGEDLPSNVLIMQKSLSRIDE